MPGYDSEAMEVVLKILYNGWANFPTEKIGQLVPKIREIATDLQFKFPVRDFQLVNQEVFDIDEPEPRSQLVDAPTNTLRLRPIGDLLEPNVSQPTNVAPPTNDVENDADDHSQESGTTFDNIFKFMVNVLVENIKFHPRGNNMKCSFGYEILQSQIKLAVSSEIKH